MATVRQASAAPRVSREVKHRMDWDKLRVFHAVTEAGSFTHAGELLNLSQSAVSRQIGGLEESLSATLFHRHARGLILTEQGELLYKTARDVFGKLAMAEAMIAEVKEKPTGPLAITTTVAFGTTWLAPRIKQFVDIYPDIDVTILVDDERELDLTMREADVAIRLRRPRQPDLVQRHLVTLHWHAYASPDYLRINSTPKTPEDLDGHSLIVFGDASRPPVQDINWLLTVGTPKGSERKPVLCINSVYGNYMAVRSGLGIGALGDYMIADDPNLVRVLPDLEGPAIDAYFVYPEELRHSKRIAVFRDFLIKHIAHTHF
jgi:DNA-binding transcriptional LysR family regulator